MKAPRKATTARAGAVVYRRGEQTTEVLLVTASDDPETLVFPKGHLEVGEPAYIAALRELKEEAGVTGRLVGSVCPKQRYRKGGELVDVQYFVVACTGEGAPGEGRERHWLALSDVSGQLTHADAKSAFDAALPVIRANAHADAAEGVSAVEGVKELLLVEYGHAADSLLRNEEDGERRVRFFLALAGALSSVALFVRGESDPLAPGEVDPVLVFLFAYLALIGYTTFLRIVQRNVASDRYKEGLNRIRRAFVQSPTDAGVRLLAFNPYDARCRKAASWRSLGRGGWLETVTLVESLILAALLALLVPAPSWWLDGFLAAGTAALAWILLTTYAARLYRSWHDD